MILAVNFHVDTYVHTESVNVLNLYICIESPRTHGPSYSCECVTHGNACTSHVMSLM